MDTTTDLPAQTDRHIEDFDTFIAERLDEARRDLRAERERTSDPSKSPAPALHPGRRREPTPYSFD